MPTLCLFHIYFRTQRYELFLTWTTISEVFLRATTINEFNMMVMSFMVMMMVMMATKDTYAHVDAHCEE